MIPKVFGVFFLLIFGISVAAIAATPAGTTIEGQTEYRYSGQVKYSDISTIEVAQEYGLTFSPTDSAGSITPEGTYYFPHRITNVGNGSDLVTFGLNNVTPEGWSAQLIVDENFNQVHELSETTQVPTQVAISEDAIYDFFLALTAPSQESTGEATVTVTSEGNDGSGYYGSNGLFYGGDDLVAATDTATVSIEAGLLSNLHIYRNDANKDIYLTWEGGAADVYYITGSYEASFSGSSVEAYGATSPWTSSQITAQDGNIRYYRVTAAGFADAYAPETVGKFDMTMYELSNFSSTPLEIDPLSANSLNNVLGTQLTPGINPSKADLIYSYTNEAWYQAYLRISIGWIGTLTIFNQDKGYWIKVNEGNPQNILTYVGEVSQAASREVTLNQGFTLVGNNYPSTVALDNTGLDNVLTAGTNPSNSDRIYCYIANASGGTWKQAYLRTGIGWIGTLTDLEPGRAYWAYKQASGNETWQYPRPY